MSEKIYWGRVHYVVEKYKEVAREEFENNYESIPVGEHKLVPAVYSQQVSARKYTVNWFYVPEDTQLYNTFETGGENEKVIQWVWCNEKIDLNLPTEQQEIAQIRIIDVYDVDLLAYQVYEKTSKKEFKTIKEAEAEVNYIIDNFGLNYEYDGKICFNGLSEIELAIDYKETKIESLVFFVCGTKEPENIIKKSVLEQQQINYKNTDEESEWSTLHRKEIKKEFPTCEEYLKWFEETYLTNKVEDTGQLNMFSLTSVESIKHTFEDAPMSVEDLYEF